ncbi:hypothetical protein [Pseudoalteromonas ostreae]|uniref:hypothetical protein n=1 Tax=Pseudoalteromonas ostreae TaxID=2774154 RepID=UPI001B35C3EE|nr:hypothetical protein [Pseudoalteromonas ostreae]
MKQISILSSVLIALTVDVTSAVEAKIGGDDGIWPPPEPCAYSMEPEIKSLGADIKVFNKQAVAPIYIGGKRYSLSKNDFTPIVEKVTYTCPGLEPLVVTKYTGYALSLPVYNDFGQKIHFDVSGRTSKYMTLDVSCGSFRASDSGNKFYISRSAITDGSCTQLNLKLKFNVTPNQPSYLDLSVTISEALD